MAEHPKDRADPEPEGAPTELDVKLPSKIALAHAEETLEQRTTLPRVPLPSRAEVLLTPVRPSSPGLPPFNPQSFPPARSPASPTGPHQLPSRRAAITGPHQLPPRTRAGPTGPHAPVQNPGRPPATATEPHLLPDQAAKPGVEPSLPEFDSRSNPPLDAEFYRPTETVRTPGIRRGGVPWILLMLLGVVLGTGVTILFLRWIQ